MRRWERLCSALNWNILAWIFALKVLNYFLSLSANMGEVLVNQEKTEYCKQTLSTTDATSLAFAVSHNYWYQMYIGLFGLLIFGNSHSFLADDLPLWALVGEVEGEKSLIYTHKKFEIGKPKEVF